MTRFMTFSRPSSATGGALAQRQDADGRGRVAGDESRRAIPGDWTSRLYGGGIPAAMLRFAALHSYDNVRPHRLPPELQDQNPTGRCGALSTVCGRRPTSNCKGGLSASFLGSGSPLTGANQRLFFAMPVLEYPGYS
jgi:hypothetical protein